LSKNYIILKEPTY